MTWKIGQEKLSLFDRLDLDDENERRLSCKPLFDFYMILIFQIGIDFCELHKYSLSDKSLKGRWIEVKSKLKNTGDIPQKYDNAIKNLQKTRNRIEHSDTYIPKKIELIKLRRMAPEFMEWIVEVGRTHYSQHIANKTLTQRFVQLSRLYIRRTDWIFDAYGDESPFLTRVDALPKGDSYQNLRELRNSLDSRLNQLKCANDITQDDFEHLIKIITEVERLDAKEYVYIERGKCPKCGGKINETRTAFGGSIEDPAPTSVTYRVGCERCDFELMSETIDI